MQSSKQCLRCVYCKHLLQSPQVKSSSHCSLNWHAQQPRALLEHLARVASSIRRRPKQRTHRTSRHCMRRRLRQGTRSTSSPQTAAPRARRCLCALRSTAQDMPCLSLSSGANVLPGLQDKNTASRTGSDDEQPAEVLATSLNSLVCNDRKHGACLPLAHVNRPPAHSCRQTTLTRTQRTARTAPTSSRTPCQHPRCTVFLDHMFA